MAPHFSTLAWRIPGMGEPGGLPSMELHRVRHNWSDLAAAAAGISVGFPGGSVGKESTCNVGDPNSISGWWRSPGEENGNPLQYSCLGNPMDRGAQWATVHGVTKSQTWVSDKHLGISLERREAQRVLFTYRRIIELRKVITDLFTIIIVFLK